MSLSSNTVANGLSWFQKVTDFLYVNIKMPLDVRFVTSYFPPLLNLNGVTFNDQAVMK